MTAEKEKNNKKRSPKAVALILAGYDKFDLKTKLKLKKEITESYDGDEIFLGSNKFLYDLAGKPVIQYVLDAVHKAKINKKPIYDEIYVYNDVKSFTDVIDVSKYPNLYVKQMTESVGGHWNDFYHKYIDFGDRVDVFFGDTARVTTEDVVWAHKAYNEVLGKRIDHRGVVTRMLFGIVKHADMKDNWCDQRDKYVKRGANKGKLKTWVGMENYQARVGNSGAMIKHPCMDEVIGKETMNLFYNSRKVLTPNNFSKMMYHLWKTKNLAVIKQIKQKCINEEQITNAAIDVVEGVYKIDLSEFSGMIFPMTKNASHWENDIDGPKDLTIFREKFEAEKKK